MFVKKKIGIVCMAILSMVLTMIAPGAKEGKAETLTTKEPSRVSVHDPSIVKSGDTYYVFGSHMANAKSDDLVNWTQINKDWNARETADAWKQDSIYGDVINNYAESFLWAGYNDGNASNDGLAIWAPDVKWNPHYEWEDGTKGAYMLYYSASSTWRRSCIGYAVAKEVEGPYEHVDTIIYSGFTTNGNYDGNSTRDTRWDNDYLHFNELIEKGVIEDVSEKWFDANGNWNSLYGPNAIDPTMFSDKDGNLYLIYGSWSGGLWVHELDEKTGAIEYPGEDGTEPVSGNLVDRYFGTRVAGGNAATGEGPYIVYDEEAGYFYLYETYGGLTAYGGYNMRLYRSENVYGPYVDAKGQKATDNASQTDNYGIKLIGNYQFNYQPGYRSAGHNSALVDEDGNRYLFYHQRFNNPDKQTERHEVRVRQQFLNEDNWPVNAVYENRGEKIEHYEDSDVIGSYDIINHGTSSDKAMCDVKKIELTEDGTVTGDLTGTWKKTTGSEKTYDYITLNVEGVTYKGIFYKQWNEQETPVQVMTFSAMGEDNTCLWGTHRTSYDDEMDKLTQATPAPTEEPVIAPTEEPAGTPSSEKETDTIKNGQNVKVNGSVYTVTNADKKEVALKKGANKTSVVIPATIKVSGVKCKVTSVASKAFIKNKKLKKVTIGKNITKIGKKTFYKQKKLKTVIIKSKMLKSIGKKAFVGIHKKAKFIMPKGKVKAYKKLLKKSS